MGIPNNADVADRLKQTGRVDEYTKYVFTRFSHNGGRPHEETAKRAAEYGFSVAYS